MENEVNFVKLSRGTKYIFTFLGGIVIWFILFVVGCLILSGIFESATVAHIFWGIISFVGVGFGVGFATVAISEGDL